MPDAFSKPVLVERKSASHFRRLLEEIYAESGDDPGLVDDRLIADYLRRIEARVLIVIGAAMPGRLIGYGAIQRRIVDHDRHAFLLMSVLSRYWGQGVGRMLMTSMIATARRIGENRLHLEVAENNVRARRLYEAFGFRYQTPFEAYPPYAAPHAVMKLDLILPDAQRAP